MSHEDGHVSKIAGVDRSEFNPEGMHVLVVEANMVSLTVLVRVLKHCKYEVTATTRADEALKILRDNKKIDIVITNVKIPDMSGFELLEIISRETDLPVIMVSADDSKSTVMKGIRHGAQAYLSKPVRKMEIQNIFQYVIRKKLSTTEKSSITKEIMEPKARTLKRLQKKIKDEDDEANTQSSGSPTNQKKPRLKWTPELHKKFADAIKQLGDVNKVQPKRLLEIMNVEGLTRENVASHLQKYRKLVKKHKESMSQEANGAINSYGHGGNSLFGISCSDRIAKLGDNNAADLIPNPNKLSNHSTDMNSVFLNPSHNMLQYGVEYSNIVDQIQQGMNNLPVQELGGYSFPTFCSGMNPPDDYMAITSQSSGYNYHSDPNPSWVPFYPNPSATSTGPSNMPFCSNPSAAYSDKLPRMLGLASTNTDATSQHASIVGPSQNLLPVQDKRHPLGLYIGANSNNRRLTTDSAKCRQYPTLADITRNDETQFLQQSSELSNMEMNILYNYGSSTDCDLSVLLKQFGDDLPPKL